MEIARWTKKIGLAILLLGLVFFDLFAYHNIVMADDDVEEVEDKLEETEEKRDKVKKDLTVAEALLQKNQAALSTTKNLLKKTETEIQRKEAELANLNKRLEFNRKILEGYLQEIYYADQDPLADLFLGDTGVESMSDDFDNLLNVEERINLLLDEIKSAKQASERVKNELDEKKEDHEKLATIQQGQQYEIKSDIKEAQATLSELNAKIDKLKNELSSLLSESVSFKNVVDAAKFAAKVTGIRKDYLLGVLVVESNLGRYTGGCTADKSKMSGYRLATFKDICEELDYNWKKRKVSCPPSGYKGTGGAMGVAQFMPDTWAGYKSSIASVTGHNPPDPWDLTDGVVAMALKLTKVDGVKQHKKSAEAKAYCIYLAGGNWAAYCDSKGVNYGEKVLYWADNYERVMD